MYKDVSNTLIFASNRIALPVWVNILSFNFVIHFKKISPWSTKICLQRYCLYEPSISGGTFGKPGDLMLNTKSPSSRLEHQQHSYSVCLGLTECCKTTIQNNVKRHIKACWARNCNHRWFMHQTDDQNCPSVYPTWKLSHRLWSLQVIICSFGCIFSHFYITDDLQSSYQHCWIRLFINANAHAPVWTNLISETIDFPSWIVISGEYNVNETAKKNNFSTSFDLTRKRNKKTASM